MGAGDAVSSGKGHKQMEFIADGVRYELMDIDDWSGATKLEGIYTEVYANGKRSFIVPMSDGIEMWKSAEYAAFRRRGYDDRWLAEYVREMRKKAVRV